jgi:uncharacterized protein (TIGR02145 family)
MKKIMVLIMFLMCFTMTQAQDILVNFTGTGDTNVVNSIQVFNFTKGDSITLNGTDVLRLVPMLTTGVSQITTSSEGKSQIYPNPMTDRSTLKFDVPEDGYADIMVIEMSGKMVFKSQTFLTKGESSFDVSNVFKGTYIIRITGKGFNYSNKLLSMSNYDGQPVFEYISTIPNYENHTLKSTNTYVEFLYNFGDVLMYKGLSGEMYKTVVMGDYSSSGTSNKTVKFNFAKCLDENGHNYTTITVGPKFGGGGGVGGGKSTMMNSTQTWMVENLNTGEFVTIEDGQTNNNVLEKWAYDNDTSNLSVYGGLYTWNEMMMYDTIEGSQGMCPSGWHLPTEDEFDTLIINLGGVFGVGLGFSIAGGKMKEMGYDHWLSPNVGATNETGFTALPAGMIQLQTNNEFMSVSLHQQSYFWTSTKCEDLDPGESPAAWMRGVQYDNDEILVGGSLRIDACSVRCIQNN